LIAKEERQVIQERIVDLLKLPIVKRLGEVEPGDLSANAWCRFADCDSLIIHAFLPAAGHGQIVRNAVAKVSESRGKTLCDQDRKQGGMPYLFWRKLDPRDRLVSSILYLATRAPSSGAG